MPCFICFQIFIYFCLLYILFCLCFYFQNIRPWSNEIFCSGICIYSSFTSLTEIISCICFKSRYIHWFIRMLICSRTWLIYCFRIFKILISRILKLVLIIAWILISNFYGIFSNKFFLFYLILLYIPINTYNRFSIFLGGDASVMCPESLDLLDKSEYTIISTVPLFLKHEFFTV